VTYRHGKLMVDAGPAFVSRDRFSLSNQPRFIVDAIVNICNLAGVHNWGDHLP